MILAVLSDVHSNVQALTAALIDAKRQGAERFVCLGDIVGYNCFPSETIQLLRAVGAECVQGNHDRMVLGLLAPQGGPGARQAIEWTRRILTPADRRFLLQLPIVRHWNGTSVFMHAALDDPEFRLRSDDHYLELRDTILQRFPYVRVCFTGHSHIGMVVEVAGRQVFRRGRKSVQLDDNSFYFVNPGSVSNARNEDYRSSYLLYDTAHRRTCFRKINYDRKLVNDEDVKNGIPPDLGSSILGNHYNLVVNGLRHWWRRTG